MRLHRLNIVLLLSTVIFSLQAQTLTFTSTLTTPPGLNEYYVLNNRFGDTVCIYYRFTYSLIKMDINGSNYELIKKKRVWNLVSLPGRDTLAITFKGKYIVDTKSQQEFRIVKAGNVYRLFTGEATVLADYLPVR